MTIRPIGILGLTLLTSVLAIADDKPPAHSSEVKELNRRAMEAASNDALPLGVELVEKALKIAPQDRDSLYLLAVMTSIQADRTEDKARRIVLLRKSIEVTNKLRNLYKEPTSYEKVFLARSRLDEARALALEGKIQESLASIRQAIAAGYDDFDAIRTDKNLVEVNKLPELRSAIEEAYQAQVGEEKKALAEEMRRQQPFAFAFELKDLDEKTVTLDDFKGKVTIVDLWGTWCESCRETIPHLVALDAKYRSKGLAIVGITCNEEGTRDEMKHTIREFAARNKMGYRLLLNDETTEEKIPDFKGYPTLVILDRAGKVRLTLRSGTSMAQLEAIVTILLAEGQP